MRMPGQGDRTGEDRQHQRKTTSAHHNDLYAMVLKQRRGAISESSRSLSLVLHSSERRGCRIGTIGFSRGANDGVEVDQ